MKKTSLLSLITIVFISNLISQAPILMSYQAVIWDTGGNLVSEKTVNIKISILKGSLTGTNVYSETHRVQTNINGLVSLMIGGGTSAAGKIADINWGSGSYFFKTETDPTGGGNYSIIGITPFVSVPYSFFSGMTGNIQTTKPGLPGQVLKLDEQGKPFWSGSSYPIVSNQMVLLTSCTASLTVNVSDDGGSPLTSRGVVWSTSPNPTITSSKVIEGNGIGSFSTTVPNLSPNTTYYIRAFATNEVGTGYGSEIKVTTFTGAAIPTVTTIPVSDITSNTVKSGGIVTGDCGSLVTARGVVWSTSTNPTISLNTKTNNGSGIGSFNSNLTGLSPNTTYYVRAYSINATGPGYGNEVTFITSDSINISEKLCPEIPSIKDIDGNIYNTLQIGTQCWTSENLRVTKYKDGTPIPLDESGGTEGNGTGQTWSSKRTGLRTVYGHNPSNLSAYGYIYNWYAISEAKGLCPSGWHIPSDLELTSLTNYLGGETVAGGKMKSVGTTYWEAPNAGATNESGFSALPGGYRGVDGSFRDLANSAFIWTTFNSNISYGEYRILSHNKSTYSYRYGAPDYGYKGIGASVRCIKDQNTSEVTIPTLTTFVETTLVTTSAIVGGKITSDGGANITARGIVWSTIPEPTLALTTKTTEEGYFGSFTSSLTNLQPKTTYYVRAYASNSVGTGYGNEISFITSDSSNVMEIPCLGSPTVKDIDGHTYNTVQIGAQCWTKENLRVTKYRDGTDIPLDESGGPEGNGPGQIWTSRTTGARTVYGHSTANLATYGYLYNWYAVVDTKRLCPNGWHVPSDSEWTSLANYLGGESIAGGKMKSIDTTKWLIPNLGATNESGFTAIPGGFRYFFAGFYDLNGGAVFWSATDYDKSSAWYYYLMDVKTSLDHFTTAKYDGASVRCLKD